MSTIKIHSIEIWTHIGITEEERDHEQCILADIDIECTESASQTDDIGDTVDYEEIWKEVKSMAKEERSTLEKFAGDIAQKILAHDLIENVTVTLTKQILPGTSGVSVTITKKK